MRELFEEGLDPLPPDPQDAARQAARGPQRKRFYTTAEVAASGDGFALTLDGRPVKTPGRRAVAAPVRAIAETMAAEWNAQSALLDPLSMPMTRLANSVIDGVADRCEAVADDIAGYFGSDLVFYRAGHPEGLVARQAQHWDPVLDWARETLGAHFILAEGVMHVRQPDAALVAVRAALPQAPWPLGALHVVTTTTGSALLALALAHGARDAEAVWAAAHVDEDWNFATWGEDAEALARRAAARRDFDAAAQALRLLAG
ncbi:MAG: ATP12 family protein [Xanthobacteraceae bacterium]